MIDTCLINLGGSLNLLNDLLVAITGVGFSKIEDKLKDTFVFTPDYGIFKNESIVELLGIKLVVMY